MPDSGYSQFCPVAMATEVLGARWNLLLLRELLAGDQPRSPQGNAADDQGMAPAAEERQGLGRSIGWKKVCAQPDVIRPRFGEPRTRGTIFRTILTPGSKRPPKPLPMLASPPSR